MLPREAGQGSELWMILAIQLAVVVGISAFSLVPAAVFLLRMKELAVGCAAWFGYAAVAFILTLVVVSSAAGSRPPAGAIGAFAVVFFSFAGAVSLALVIARARGYRLRFPGERATRILKERPMSAPKPDERRGGTAPPVHAFGEQASDGDTIPHSLATIRLVCAAALLSLVLCAIVNVAAVPFGENLRGPPEGLELILIAVGLGMIGGQIGALSGILVWSRGSFVVRWVVFWLVGMALVACWAFGLLRLTRDEDWFLDFRVEIARAIAASLPLISLAVQLPQWMARFYLGWRLDPPGNRGGESLPGLSIRDLLVGTVVAALTITAARLSPAAPGLQNDFWLAWAIATPILASISALVMLPLLVLIFRCRARWALLYIAIGSPVLAGVTMLVIVLVEGSGGPDGRAVAIFLLAAVSCVATTSIPFWLAPLRRLPVEDGPRAVSGISAVCRRAPSRPATATPPGAAGPRAA